MWVRSLGWKDPLEKRMGTHSSPIDRGAWWGHGYSPWGCKEVGTTEHYHCSEKGVADNTALTLSLGFPGGSVGTESACDAGGLGGEDPLEEGMATYSSILAWRIPWTEEPAKRQFMGSQRVRCD